MVNMIRIHCMTLLQSSLDMCPVHIFSVKKPCFVDSIKVLGKN